MAYQNNRFKALTEVIPSDEIHNIFNIGDIGNEGVKDSLQRIRSLNVDRRRKLLVFLDPKISQNTTQRLLNKFSSLCFLLHPNLPEEVLRTLSDKHFLKIFPHPCLSETFIDKFINARVSGSCINLHCATEENTLAIVAGALNPGAVLYLGPNTEQNKITVAAQFLNRDAILCLLPTTDKRIIYAARQALNPGAVLEVCHPREILNRLL